MTSEYVWAFGPPFPVPHLPVTMKFTQPPYFIAFWRLSSPPTVDVTIYSMFPDRAASPRPRPAVHPVSASGQCEKLGNTRRRDVRTAVSEGQRRIRETLRGAPVVKPASSRPTVEKKPFSLSSWGPTFFPTEKTLFSIHVVVHFGGLFARGAE